MAMNQWMLAAVTGEDLISAIMWLIVWGGVFWLLYWAVGKIAPPEPFAKIAQILLVLGAAFMCINVLLGLTGNAIIKWK